MYTHQDELIELLRQACIQICLVKLANVVVMSSNDDAFITCNP